MFLTPHEVVLRLPSSRSEVVRMRLLEANSSPVLLGEGELPGTSNYLLGPSAGSWKTDVPHLSRVRYHEIYDGIDLVLYGNQGSLEYDFVVAPNTSPSSIRMEFDGARSLCVDESGDLRIALSEGELQLAPPIVFQTTEKGEPVLVEGSYAVEPETQEVSFRLASYDREQPLVIDPVLVFSTYLGGTDGDPGVAIQVSDTGDVYIAGYTDSLDFPTQGAYQGSNAGGSADAFVAKLDASGSELVYSTYLGGTGSDRAHALGVHTDGSVVVVGQTDSTDFPTQSPYQAALAGNADAFVTRLDPTGTSLIYSTYLGVATRDGAYDVALNSAGNAYVTGVHNDDALAAQFYPNGGLVWGGTFGGTSTDIGLSIALGPANTFYLGGYTYSGDFPTVNPLQPTLQGTIDGFVMKLEPGTVLYSTYLGGSATESVADLAVDSSGYAFATGYTDSPDFPTQSAFDGALDGAYDGFVTRIQPDGSALVYSTYLGGSGSDFSNVISIDSVGAAYLGGTTDSSDYPTSAALQSSLGGALDAFLTKLAPSGGSLETSTYLGGVDDDEIFAIALDSAGTIFIAGSTSSDDFPTRSPLQPARSGLADAFVTKIFQANERLHVGLGPGPNSPPRSAWIERAAGSYAPQVYALDHYGTLQAGVNVSGARLNTSAGVQFLTGPGNVAVFGPHVRGWNEAAPINKISFYSYGTLKYGVKVRGIEADGDSYDEILTGAGQGSVFGPHVRAFEYDNSALQATKVNYFAYSSGLYGVNIDAGDLDGDGIEEVVTGKVFDAGNPTTVRGWNVSPASGQSSIGAINFDAFSSPNAYGVSVALGDIDGDGTSEILCARGPAAAVNSDLRGFDYDGASVSSIPGLSLLVYNTMYGMNLASSDVNTDGSEEICAAPGPDPTALPVVRAYDWNGAAVPVPGLFDLLPFGSSVPSAREGATLGAGGL